MPDLHWNLEKQETTHKEEIQEAQETKRLNKTLEVAIYMILFIYSYILGIQDTVLQYAKITREVTQDTIKTVKSIIRKFGYKSRESYKRDSITHTYAVKT